MFKGTLLAGGRGFESNGTRLVNMAQLKESSLSSPAYWAPFAPYVVPDNNKVTVTLATSDKLYVAGDFYYIDILPRASLIAAWNGTGWANPGMCGSQSSSTGPSAKEIKALAIYKNKLCVAGSFDKMDDNAMTANNIACIPI